jgi:plastocyanin
MSFRFGVILLAGLCLAACGGGGSTTTPSPSPTPTPTPTPTGATATVTIVNGASLLTSTAYSPTPLNVSVGTTVTWVNNDSTAHDSTAVNNSFSTGTIAPGRSGSFKFQSAGSFPYYCTIHPGMAGTVNVQ